MVHKTYLRFPALLAALAAMIGSVGCDQVDSLDPHWLLSTTHPTETPAAGEWTGHRGGTRHGVAPDAPLPIHFGPTRNVRWKVDLPGTGNSSPTVSGDRVFVTAQRGGSPPELLVVCIDRRRGDIRWQRSVGVAEGQTHHRNGYASATAATDGERVYVTFGRRGVFCFSVHGDSLWHTPLDHLEHPWGHASSPILCGDLVIQLADGAHDSRLLAMNCYSGQIVWSTPRPSTGCWTTPVLVPVTVDGQRRWEIVVNGTGSANGTAGHVIAYEPQSGDQLWSVVGTSDIPCPTAIVGRSLVVSTSGRNGPVIAIRPGGRGDVTDSHVAWRLPWGGPHVPTGVIAAERLFLVSDGGILRCLDMQDGRKLWQKRLHRSYSASLVAGDGKLYAVSERGDVHVFETGETCRLLAVNPLRQRCRATPAIAHGELLVRTQRSLYCFAEGASATLDSAAASVDAPAPASP